MKAISKADLYRRLPSVDELLRRGELAHLVPTDGLTAATDAARVVLGRLREEISAGRLEADGVDLALSGLAQAVEREARQALSYSICSVINATGVILHTNLGRAPLSSAALDHIREVSSAYSNLEFDIADGDRGKRDVHVDRLFGKLFADLNVGAGVPARAAPG